MREILPGLFHWSTLHEPIDTQVSSYFVEPAGMVIDPKVPDGGFDALPARPRQVLLTSGHHDRDAERFAEAFTIPIRVSPQAAQRLDGRFPVDVYDDGEELAPGITAVHVGVLSEDEGALHLSIGDGAMAFADGVHHYGDKLGFFPDHLLGDDPEAVKRGLREAFATLLRSYDFDTLLFAHGEPIVGGGRRALQAFADG
jgi:hypothetical protein